MIPERIDPFAFSAGAPFEIQGRQAEESRRGSCFMTKNALEYLRWKESYTTSAYRNYAPFVCLFDSLGKPDMPTLIRYTESLKTRYGARSVVLGMHVVKDYVGYLSRRGRTKIAKEDIRIPRAPANPHPHLTAEEYVSILSFVKADTVKGLRDNVLIRLLYDTGARIGEIVTLSRGDLDIRNRIAEIRTEKTRTRRVIVWGSDTNIFLCEYLEQEPTGFLPGKRQCERIIRKYATLAKISKHITCHSFRHTRAHVILDNGGTVKDVQETLGHLDPRSSFAYLSMSKEEAIGRSRRFLDLDLTE